LGKKKMALDGVGFKKKRGGNGNKTKAGLYLYTMECVLYRCCYWAKNGTFFFLVGKKNCMENPSQKK
jgi:hypothetical protein